MLLPDPAVQENIAAQPARLSGASAIVARFLPSLTDLAFVLPLIFLFSTLGGVRALLRDGDTGWHIRTGEWILAHHRVPHIDMFSFTAAGKPWFAWEWLTDVLFGALDRRWGLAAVVLTSILLICFTSVALFRLVRRKCDNGLVAIAVTLLATGGCAIHWLARPHLFTLFFFTITLHITERAAEGRTKLLGWLVPLTLLWTNLHGGFFVIFLVLACYIGSDLLNAAIESNARLRRDFLISARPWILTAAACLAVTFINPYGWGLHKHVIEYMTDPYQLQHISEFQSADFHSPVVVYFEPLMFLAVLAAFEDARRRRFADVFMTLGWLHLALIVQRNIPLFAIAASPAVARGLTLALAGLQRADMAAWSGRAARAIRGFTESFEQTDRLARVHLASTVPMVVIGALLFAPRPLGAKLTCAFDPAVFPEQALPALREPGVTHIFSTDQWGDYLIYRLYPSKRVFTDGRSDFYGAKFGNQYLDLINGKYGWEKTFGKYGIDTVLLSPSSPLATTLRISRDWRVTHDDGVAIVFRRAGVGQSRTPVSLVSSDEGKIRDRAVAETTTRDRKITKPTL